MLNIFKKSENLIWKNYPEWHHILILSDLHSGSIYAPWPDELDPIAGERNAPDKERQRFLNRKWDEMVSWLPNKIEATLLNGDTLHGEEPKDGGKFCMTPIAHEQALGAEVLLKKVRPKTDKMYLLKGTPYHEGYGSELELLGGLLSCEKWDGESYAGTVLEKQWHGINLNASHHNTGGGMLTSGVADRMALMAAASEGLLKTVHADVIIRGHLHQKRIVQVFNKLIIFCPAWQLVTPRVVKVREYYKANVFADLGAIILSCPPGGSSVYDLKTTCFSFNLPRRDLGQL
jgi:hypothetical protein